MSSMRNRASIERGWASFDGKEYTTAQPTDDDDELSSELGQTQLFSHPDGTDYLSDFLDGYQTGLETETTSTTTGDINLTPTSSSMNSYNNSNTRLFSSPLNEEILKEMHYHHSQLDDHSFEPNQYQNHQPNFLSSHYSSQSAPDNHEISTTHDHTLSFRQHHYSSNLGEDLYMTTGGWFSTTVPEESANELLLPEPVSEGYNSEANELNPTTTQPPWSAPFSVLNMRTEVSHGAPHHETYQPGPPVTPRRSGGGPDSVPEIQVNGDSNWPCRADHALLNNPEVDHNQSPKKSNNGKVKCPVCKKLLMPSSMSKHKLTHQPKQFPCHNCDRVFATNKDLSRHVKAVHLGERNYTCDICGRRFNRSENTRRHRSTVHLDVAAEEEHIAQEEASNFS